jgi:DNA-directed RNA polymerase beta' subunit
METVEFQNQACIEVCGDQKGKRCDKGCMHRYSAGPVEGRIFDNAFKIFRNVEVDSFTVDAIMINDGEKLTTLLYDRTKVVKKQLDYLAQYKLSKAESKIMELYLKGYSNHEIANKLFISKGTLRSHLNSIYKKIPEALKAEILATAEAKIVEIQNAFDAGLLTEDERYVRVINVWSGAKEEVQAVSKETLDKLGPVFMMINSGARGSWAQTTQMMGMKGLVANPSGKTMELPVKASFKEGFDVLEYFISTHGARKGLTDTALRTANAGYLTRRLVDVSQDVVVALSNGLFPGKKTFSDNPLFGRVSKENKNRLK